MDSFGFSGLALYASPPNNVLGTGLFLSYTLAALCLVTILSVSLYRRYAFIFSVRGRAEERGELKAARDARSRHVKIYAFLASISFAVLSYHMLNFLIESYLRWGGLRDISKAGVSVEELKRWMFESMLFESFARELVHDGPSAVWAQIAILGTWFSNVWMAGKGVW